MKKASYLSSAVVAALFTLPTSFAQTNDQPNDTSTTSTTTTTSTNVAPDNSQVNQRDRAGMTKTADTQAKSTRSNTEVTRMIRRQLTKDDSLSTYAKNVKIVTTGSSITLRGPVNTEEEKTAIESVAEKFASDRTVNNQLEVKQEAQKVQN